MAFLTFARRGCAALLCSLHLVTAAAALEEPKSLFGQRGFFLQGCPRADALMTLENAQDLAWKRAPAEHVWNTVGKRGFESGLSLALLAAAPAVIEGGLDALGAWLDARAAARETSRAFTATGFAAVPSVSGGSSLVQCLVLISGDFAGFGADLEIPRANSELAIGEWSGDWLVSFGLVGEPDFYAEIEMEYASSRAAFRLAPRFVEFRKSGIDASPTATRDLSLALVFSMNGRAIGAAALPLGPGMRVGTLLVPRLLSGVRSAWIPVAPPAGPVASHGWLTSATMSAQVTLVESTGPSELDRLLVELFALSRPALSAFAKSAVESKPTIIDRGD